MTKLFAQMITLNIFADSSGALQQPVVIKDATNYSVYTYNTHSQQIELNVDTIILDSVPDGGPKIKSAWHGICMLNNKRR